MAPAQTLIGPWETITSPLGFKVAIGLAGLAVAGGLYIVPAFSAVQAWAGPDHRARVIAGVNVLNALFMVVGSLVLDSLKLGFAELFLIVALLNFVVAVIIGWDVKLPTWICSIEQESDSFREVRKIITSPNGFARVFVCGGGLGKLQVRLREA